MLLIDRQELDRIIAAAFFIAIGVMLALCVAALFWQAPGPVIGSHAIILDSTLSAQRIEPREKAFYTLAVAFGFAMALAVLAFRVPQIICSCKTVFMLAAVVLILDVCCKHALNEIFGAWWALGGVGSVLLLTWAAKRVSR